MWDQMKTTLYSSPFLLHKESQQLPILVIIEASLLLWMGSLAWCQKSWGPRKAWLISSSPCFQTMQIAYPQYLLGPEQFLFPLRILFSFPNDLFSSEIFFPVCWESNLQSLRFLPSWHRRSSSVHGRASYTFCKDSLFLSSHLWQFIYAL